jgi:hypothetical protein
MDSTLGLRIVLLVRQPDDCKCHLRHNRGPLEKEPVHYYLHHSNWHTQVSSWALLIIPRIRAWGQTRISTEQLRIVDDERFDESVHRARTHCFCA